MSTDLTFTNNQSWVLVLGMSEWAKLYDLTQGTFLMQARAALGDPAVVYQWGSPALGLAWGGSMLYEPTSKLLIGLAAYADVRRGLPAGGYVYDVQYTVPGSGGAPPLIVRDLASGALSVTEGVTQS